MMSATFCGRGFSPASVYRLNGITMFFHRPPFTLDTHHLESLGQKHHDDYVNAAPFAHAVFDDFLPLRTANYLLKDFPKPESPIWLDWKKRDIVHQPKKQGIGHASRLDGISPYLLNALAAFNSYPFLNFLEKLTGIPKLLPDPYFHGGGLHQILSGGKLAVHTDFNQLDAIHLYRRLNVLLYLNKNWKAEYNGELELWNQNMTQCEVAIPPLFNRLVVFNTNKKSFHGHPKPLNTPEGITRKSIALYFYTAQPNEDELYDGITDWQETDKLV